MRGLYSDAVAPMVVDRSPIVDSIPNAVSPDDFAREVYGVLGIPLELD